MVLRIAGTFPVTAQSPSDTTIRLRRRMVWIFFRSSWLLMAPSTSVTSTPSGNSCASTSGPYTMSALRATTASASSMSSNDMWQPEHPSSQTVASLILLMPLPREGASAG